MRHVPAAELFLGVLLSSCAGGCIGTKAHVVEQQTNPVVDPFDAAQELELPPKEKSKASLAAAQMLDKNGKTDEAVKLYERARALNSSYGHVARRLAVLYDRQGNFAKANEEYDKAIAIFPKDAALFNDAGYSRYCQGNWTLAEDYLRQAIELKPEMKGAWNNLGMTLAQRERLDEALGAFSHAVSEPEARCNLAFVFTSQGKTAEAIAEYRKALAIAPEMMIARQALAMLETPPERRTVPVVGAAADRSAPRRPVEDFATTHER